MKRTVMSKVDSRRGGVGGCPPQQKTAAAATGTKSGPSAKSTVNKAVKAPGASTKIPTDGGNQVAGGSAAGITRTPQLSANSTPKMPVRKVVPPNSKGTPIAGGRRDAGYITPSGIRAAAADATMRKTGLLNKKIKEEIGMKGVTMSRGTGKSAKRNENEHPKPRNLLGCKALSNQDVNQLKASALSQRNPNSDDGHGGSDNPEAGFLPSRSVDSLTKISKKSVVVSPEKEIGSVDSVTISTQTEEDENERWKNNTLRFRVHELETELQDAVKDLVSTQIELQKMKDEKEKSVALIPTESRGTSVSFEENVTRSPIPTESRGTSVSFEENVTRSPIPTESRGTSVSFEENVTRSPIPTESKGTLDSFGEESPEGLPPCPADVEFELEEKLKELEEKYQKQMTDNLKLQADLESKDKEISIWIEKNSELQHELAVEKSKIEKEMIAIAEQQSDMLLVVQAAESYRMDAQAEVNAVQQEISSLKEKITALENKLKNTTASNTVRKQGVGIQVLIEDNKTNNKRDSCDPKDVDNGLNCSLSSNRSLSPHDGSDKENRSSNDETESGVKTPNITPNILRAVSALKSRIADLGSSGELEEDPLVPFVKVSGGSKRNALLRWCQSRTVNYKFVDITNFSTSWSDGLALCALLHSYIPDKIQYDLLSPENSRQNFEIAMKAADSVSIPPILNIDDIVNNERPSWENVMNYVKEIYLKFANCDSNPIPM